MKQTSQPITGTSFNNITVLASLNELTKVLGKPRIVDDPDSNFKYEWRMEYISTGDVFAVYDWMNDTTLKGTTKIKWHIGSKNAIIGMAAREKIIEAIIQL